MNIANASPLSKQETYNMIRLEKSWLDPAEYASILKEHNLEDYEERQVRVETLQRPTLERSKYEAAVKALGLVDEPTAGQKVRDIMMVGKGKESRPIFDKILEMRGEMTREKGFRKILKQQFKPVGEHGRFLGHSFGVDEKGRTEEQFYEAKLERILQYGRETGLSPLEVLDLGEDTFSKLQRENNTEAFSFIKADILDKLSPTLEPILSTLPTPTKVYETIRVLKDLDALSKNYDLVKHLQLFRNIDVDMIDYDDAFVDTFIGLPDAFKNGLLALQEASPNERSNFFTELASLMKSLKSEKEKINLQIEPDTVLKYLGFDEELAVGELVDTEVEDVDEGDEDTPPTYVRRDIFESRTELPGTGYSIVKQKIYETEFEKVKNDEGEWDYDPDEQMEDDYPTEKYYVVKE